MPRVTLSIRGKANEWDIDCEMSQGQIDAMVADGVDIGLLENTIPMWVVDLGLLRPWCFVQDVWNFKNPFRRDGWVAPDK